MTLARLSQASVELVGRLPAAVIEWLAKVPTTNLRVVMTIAFVGLTTVRYVLSGIVFDLAPGAPRWVPGWEWLAFLLAALGVDSLHFAAKRVTDANYVAAKQGNGHATPPGPEAGA